jgi:hypothetical protein
VHRHPRILAALALAACISLTGCDSFARFDVVNDFDYPVRLEILTGTSRHDEEAVLAPGDVFHFGMVTGAPPWSGELRASHLQTGMVVFEAKWLVPAHDFRCTFHVAPVANRKDELGPGTCTFGPTPR